MSRNLLSIVCESCGDTPVLLEEPRPMRKSECGVYNEFEGMIVAEAECPSCLSHYLAWIHLTNCKHARDYGEQKAEYGKFFDLSYFGSFNDEPGTDKWGRYDGPQYEVQTITTRLRVAKITQEGA